MEGIRWLAGEPEPCSALERAWTDPAAAGAERTLLRDRPGRRHLSRLHFPSGPDLFIKRFYLGDERHRLRKRTVRLLRIEAARREWRALVRLRRAGVAVPTPRALGVLPDGDRILAVDFLPGRNLDAALTDPALDRARLAEDLGRLVAGLHAAGVIHRDLHHGNILLADTGPVLLDLQLARPGRSRRARLRDLGDLDAAIEPFLSLAQRLRLRAAALGVERPFDAAARRALHAVGEASLRRARAHGTSRRRRALRPGRRFVRVSHAAGSGLRLRDFEPEALATLLARHAEGDGEVLKQDARSRVVAHAANGRRVVVKEYLRAEPSRVLADRFRGTPARRAWLAGFGLEAHGIGAARPLAFLERRRLGLLRGSLLVMEDLRPARPCHELAASDAPEMLRVLTRLAHRLHARGIHHGDLQADHVWLSPGAAGLEARLIDLESVRFRSRLSDSARRLALAQLNAALPDAVKANARCLAFARYALLLPFDGPASGALDDVVRTSLARRHRWSGAGCARAKKLSRDRP